MKTAIVTDSTSYIPKDIREEWGIEIVPLNVIFGDTSYQEEFELSSNEFYEKIKTEENLPKTSQPSIGYVTEVYERLAKDYDAIISVHLSSKLSGTYQGAISASQMVEGVQVYPFDSEIAAMPLGFYALEAARLAKEGKDPETILARLENIKSKMEVFLMVDDLSHLHRGGRLSGAQALVGSLLQMKPVLTFEEGKIIPYEKIRTRKKAVNRIKALFDEKVLSGTHTKLTIIHAKREEEALQLKAEIEEKYDNVEIIISSFGPVIGTHLGEGAIGMAWYSE